MNAKGFTLVELLAIITILGVIMGLAIPAYQHYVTKTRNEGYRTLVTTIRTAAQNKYMEDEFSSDYCTKYSIEELYLGGYMDKPSDPANTSIPCQGEVHIRQGNDEDSELTMENYEINVHLVCSTYETVECKDSGGSSCIFTNDDMQYCGISFK